MSCHHPSGRLAAVHVAQDGVPDLGTRCANVTEGVSNEGFGACRAAVVADAGLQRRSARWSNVTPSLRHPQRDAIVAVPDGRLRRGGHRHFGSRSATRRWPSPGGWPPAPDAMVINRSALMDIIGPARQHARAGDPGPPGAMRCWAEATDEIYLEMPSRWAGARAELSRDSWKRRRATMGIGGRARMASASDGDQPRCELEALGGSASQTRRGQR